MNTAAKIWGLHLAVLVTLFAAQVLLPPYYANQLARVLILAIFAMGYNIAHGYTGLLSLGHALFFAFGMYGAGLAVWQVEWTTFPALVAGLVAGGVSAAAVGLLALRTTSVSFMIVTLMFAQAGYLTILYFGSYTGGDEGFVVEAIGRQVFGYDLAQDAPRARMALVLFGAALLANLWLVRSPFGRVMVAIRENEERSRMLGYNPFRVKMIVMIISGVYAGLAGAAYGILFGYVGASFATVQYSILPMLYALMGGSGTVLGPLLGTIVMFALVEIASIVTSQHLLVVGVALVGLVLFAPRGLLGAVRHRWFPWLP